MLDSPSNPDVKPLSKTKKKQQSAEMQNLGLELCRLSPKALDTLKLDSELRASINAAQKIKQGGAFKRQVKFIGGLLRQKDIGPVQEMLARLKLKSGAAAAEHHRLEKWRERLLNEGDSVIGELLELAPTIDRQHLRQLVRKARREIDEGKHPRATRELYQYLKEFL